MPDLAFAIVKGDKVHRITFSKSLADHIVSYLDPDYEVRRVRFKTGRRLKPGEKSSTGLYAIVSAQKNWTLRITLFDKLADLWRDSSRYVAEAFLI